MATMQPSQLAALCFYLVTMSQFYYTLSSRPTGFSLKLIHKDSLESLLYPGNLTYLERMERLIRSSETRGYYLENLSCSKTTTEPAEIINFPTNRDGLSYMVSTAIGSQSIQLFLLFDTGSGAIWTQCKPCESCFNQRSPMYDSQTSTSYRKLDCGHPFCSGNKPIYRCVAGHCVYKHTYASKASTSGIASLEKFLFHEDESSAMFIDNIVFGCSNDNRGFRGFSKKGSISGILGLSKRPDSLISQLSSDVDQRFSYCMAPFSDLLQQNGFLRFGDDIPPPSKNVQTTRFVNVPGRFFYNLNLLDITVGSLRLGFTPDQFEVRRDGSGGFLIDSGTTISRIDQTVIRERNAYDDVMTLFESYYDARNLQREVIGPSKLDLCYQYPPGFNDFATMTYHFEEADYRIEGQYVHYPGDESLGYFCVALTPGNGMSVLGTWHQQNMRITYDGNVDELQFAPENCLDDL